MGLKLRRLDSRVPEPADKETFCSLKRGLFSVSRGGHKAVLVHPFVNFLEKNVDGLGLETLRCNAAVDVETQDNFAVVGDTKCDAAVTLVAAWLT